MTKYAVIYEIDGRIFVHSRSTILAGGATLTSPMIVIESHEREFGLGAAVLRCLNESRSKVEVPEPSVMAKLFDPILKQAGIKSFKKFVERAESVSVALSEDGQAIFTSSRRQLGARAAFLPILSMTVEASADSSPALALAALEALAKSE